MEELARLDNLLCLLGHESFARALIPEAKRALCNITHGDYSTWMKVVKGLPCVAPSKVDFSLPAVTVVAPDGEGKPALCNTVASSLRGLMPWRKGPFDIHGVFVDAEWRSDMKWARLSEKIAPLDSRLVLDVGCGNGYYCLRMLGDGAEMVIGIDPSPLFLCQFRAITHFTGPCTAFFLPLRIDEFPIARNIFDTVFSMGLLYHRRNPLGHLSRLRELLKPGGELVLETIVLNTGSSDVLVPEGRYAKMNNVWFIPSPALLEIWLGRTGFRNVRVVDITPTTPAEQRRTAWMDYESLSDFLSPENPRRTVEGYPAPERAVILAEKPRRASWKNMLANI